jgi:cyanophycinase
MFGVLLMLLAQVEPAAKPPAPAAITPRTRAILARLEERVSMPFPEETPLDEVLQHIRRAAEKGPDDPGLPIYIDPMGLQRAERSLNATVMIHETAIPLKDALTRVLASLRMAYIVKDDVLIVTDVQGVRQEQREVPVRACDATPATRALMARLEEPVKMPFSMETPLDYALDYLKRATARPPDDPGIKVLVILEGLEEVERSLNSTVMMDLEGVPLKTTLRLLLDQLGLACAVRDGRLVIHSRQGIRKLIRNAEAAEPPQGALVICGGGGLPESARREFVRLAGGPKAKIVVIPTASEYADGPAATLAEYLESWTKQGVASAVVLHTRSRARADEPGFARPLEEATGVWFSGGDQSRVTDAYLGTAVERALRAVLDRGGVIGGMSAGAAIMSRVMITGGQDRATVGTGFGFLPGVVVDQHALRRNRVNRLLGVLADHPDLVGVAIDESTALVVRQGRWQVMGDSYIVTCLVPGGGQPTRIEVFHDGDRGSLADWKPRPGPVAPQR